MIESASSSVVSAHCSKRPTFNRLSRIWKPTAEYFSSPWDNFVEAIRILQHRRSRFITMSQALAGEYDADDINILLDHHIDFYPIETEAMCRWERMHGIVSNVYLFNRFERPEYGQPRWRVEDINVAFYQDLERAGFEIGYHQNAVGTARALQGGHITDIYRSTEDKSEISPQILDQARCIFSDDVNNLRRYFRIRTFIPHGAGEGNAYLLDVPEECRDLVWVYNNNSRNGAAEAPLKWQNFTDSVGGASPQRLKGHKAEYAVYVDNLCMNAYLAKTGLNHILIHAGRWAKGMPYELYEDGCAGAAGPYTERYEFEGLEKDGLPVRQTDVLEVWLAARGEQAGIPFGGGRTQKYYVITDDESVIRSHLAESTEVIAIHWIDRKMSWDEKKRVYRPTRPIQWEIPLPRPEQPFFEAFRHFHNTLFSDNILEHLAVSAVPLDVVVLREVCVTSWRDAEMLVRVLKRAPVDAAIRLTLSLKDLDPRRWRLAYMQAAEQYRLEHDRFIVEEAEGDASTLVVRAVVV